MSSHNEMLHIINQARADAKREGLKKVFQKHSKTIAAFVIVVVIGLIVWSILNFYQKLQEEKFSAMLHQSILYQQSGEVSNAKLELEKIMQASSAPNNIKAFASLRYAAFLLSENKKQEAVEVYQKVGMCGSCDDYVKDFANLLLVKFWVADEQEFAKEDLSLRIEKIEEHSTVLKYYIAEQRALLELQKHNLEKSYQIYESIIKNSAESAALKSRAEDGLKMVIGKGYNK